MGIRCVQEFCDGLIWRFGHATVEGGYDMFNRVGEVGSGTGVMRIGGETSG